MSSFSEMPSSVVVRKHVDLRVSSTPKINSNFILTGRNYAQEKSSFHILFELSHTFKNKTSGPHLQ